MPGFGANLAGLAAMPQGYIQANQKWSDQAAMDALGKGLMALSGATAPTAPTQPTGLLPRLAQGVGQMFGGAPSGGATASPPTGPGPAGPPSAGPGIMSAPLPSPPPGGGGGAPAPNFNPNAGFMPPGGGGGAAPMQPPGMPGGMPHNMDWRDITRAVSAANPGAAPDVIAAAVTKAMPLMNQDSQQQWRAVQMMMQQQGLDLRRENMDRTAADRSRGLDIREQQLGQAGQRLQQGQDKLDLANRREDRLQQNMQWAHDTKAQELQMKAQAARDKATQFGQNMDLKQRAALLKEMDQHQRAYDSYMRSKINASANLTGADKKDALKELDRQWGEYDQQRRTLQEDLDSQGKGVTARQPMTGQQMLNAAHGQPATPGVKQLPNDKLFQVQQYISANPGQRDAVIQELQAKGYDTSGF